MFQSQAGLQAALNVCDPSLQVTSLSLSLPSGLDAQGKWQCPHHAPR